MASNDVRWSRPTTVPVPTIWRRCTGLKKMPDGNIPKFIIQDVPDERQEEVVDFMTKHFFRDEVTCECLDLLEDPVSMKEFQDIYRKLLKKHVGLVAFLDEENVKPGQRLKIAGCNITTPVHRSEKVSADIVSNCNKFIIHCNIS